MARELRKQEVADAVKTFCELHPELSCSSNEKGFCIMPGDILVYCEEGKLVCTDPATREKLVEIIVMAADTATQEPAKAPRNDDSQKGTNVPARPRSGQVPRMAGQGKQTSLTLEKVRDYFCKTATEEECMFALEVCEIRGLNPFKRDCFFVKYDGKDPKLEIIASKDFFMKKAMSHPDFEWFKSGVVVQRGEEFMSVKRSYPYPGEMLIGGWAETKRKSISEPFYSELPLAGYKKENKFWNMQPGPGHMIQKCASTDVLRKAYPDEFGGLYDADEMAIEPDYEVRG